MIIIVYAFTMTQYHSIGGAKVATIEQLNRKVEALIKKGAQVLSIRVYREAESETLSSSKKCE